MNLAAIRSQLQQTLAQASGVRVYDTVPDNPQVPCIIVIPETVRYGQTFSGEATCRFVLQILAASVNSRGGQQTLDGLISDSGDQSVVQLLEADPTLGGTVSMCSPIEVRSYGTVGDTVRYYSAEMTVDVWAA
jgi:hypothetical protein